jgi:hypothetical protein
LQKYFGVDEPTADESDVICVHREHPILVNSLFVEQAHEQRVEISRQDACSTFAHHLSPGK